MEIAGNSAAVGQYGIRKHQNWMKKALLNIVRNRIQKVRADTGIFPGQHRELGQWFSLALSSNCVSNLPIHKRIFIKEILKSSK